MLQLPFTGDTPLACTGLIIGDYYKIDDGESNKYGQLASATILNIVFRIFVENDKIVYKEYKMMTVDLVDNKVVIYHIGEHLSISTMADILYG